jgi:hypothetical protein
MDFIPIAITTGLFIVIIVAYFLYITRPKGKKSNNFNKVDLGIIISKWEEIGNMMKVGGPANYRQSIMEADKIVDLALKSKVSGETMGERLKNARHLFDPDTYNKLWTAHKIRNKVAHEADFDGLSSDANLAVRNFEKALKELKII